MATVCYCRASRLFEQNDVVVDPEVQQVDDFFLAVSNSTSFAILGLTILPSLQP